MRNLGYFNDLENTPFNAKVKGKTYPCPSLKQLEMLQRDFNSVIAIYSNGGTLFDKNGNELTEEQAFDSLYELRKAKWIEKVTR